MKNERVFLNKDLQSDDVFVDNSIVDFSTISKLPARRGYDRAVVSNGKIVNLVSNSYGHLSNQTFFNEVESKLINADIDYSIRSINRDDRTFVVDYILNNDNYVIELKGGLDKIRPMLRFTNSYDGSVKTSGHFGYFREICSNGLHLSHTNIGFSMRHRSDICEVIVPEISSIVTKFLDNEFFTIKSKFQKLDEYVIFDKFAFIQDVCKKTNIFQFEKSDKNPDPSLNARLVAEIMEDEMSKLNSEANLWLGYNAFNSVIHDKLKMNFDKQKSKDLNIFQAILEY